MSFCGLLLPVVSLSRVPVHPLHLLHCVGLFSGGRGGSARTGEFLEF